MASTAVRYDIIARDSASRTFNRVGHSASTTERMLGKLGRTAKIAGEAMVGGLAVGLAVSAKHAAEFQSSMTKISTQAGGTAKDVKQLSDQVLKLGRVTQQGPQQLSEALYHLKSVGMDNVKAMQALKQASDLAAVGGSSLEETTNALAGAWRTGIKGAGSFHEAVSTVNAIIGAGNMRMEEFTAAIGTGILPSAKTFGLSLKQVGAALALMTDEGIPAVDAATRLRMSFSLLGAPSGAAEKQLKKIGLTGLNLADAMRGKDGLIGAVQLLKDHLDKSGMSASKQSQLLSRAFGGGRSSSAILTLLNNLDVLKKKQDQVNRSTGRFDDAVRQQRKTAEAQWKLLTSNLEVMSIRVGTKVLPPLTQFVKFLSGTAMPAASRFGRAMGNLIPVDAIRTGISNAKGLVGDFLKGFSGTKKTAGDLLGGLLDTSPHLGSGKTAAKVAGPALAPMPHFGVGQVAPANGRIASVGQFTPPHLGSGMVAPLVKAAKAAPPKSAAEKLGETIRKAVTGGINGMDWGKLGANLGKGLGDAIGWIGKHTADLTRKFAGILSSINWVDVGKAVGGQAIPFALGFINNLLAPLFSLSFWKKHWVDVIYAVITIIPVGRIAGGLAKVFERIPFLRVVAPLLRGVERMGGWVEKGLGRIFRPIGRGIRDAFTKVFPEAAAALERETGLLSTRLGVWGLDLLGKGKAAVRWLGEGVSSGVEWVATRVFRLVRAVVSPFARAGGWLLERGKAVVTGLKNGVVTGARAIGSWTWRTVGRPAVNAFRDAGSWLWSKGKALVVGFKNGAISGAAKIGGWAYRTVIKPSVDVFAGAGKWVWGKGRSFVGGFKDGVVSVAKTIGSWTSDHMISPVTSRFARAGSWLYSKGSSLISGLKSGIVGGIKGIGRWIKSSLVDPVVNSVKHFFGIHSPSRVFMGIGGHLVSGLMKGMAKTSGTAIAKKVFGSLPKALAHIVKKGLVSLASLPGKAMKALGGLGGGLLSFLGIGGGGGGGSVNRWSGAVASVLQMLGAPAYAQGAVLKRIEIESGGNPNAINLTDSNARAGHPSQGLMQTIPSTFNAYAGPFRSRGITDPLASIYAGVNYAMHRYGGNWINIMTRPGGYAKGTGGAAKGLAWVGERGPELVNFKGGEDVLSHPQSMAFAKTHGIKLPGYASGTILNAADRVHRDKQRVEDAKDALANARRRHKGVAAAEKRLQAAQKELKAAEISLRNAQRSAKTSISNTIATGLLKTLSTGTSSAIASAIKSLATKLLNAGYKGTAASVQKRGAKLESLADKRASVQKTIAAANQYAADQAGNIKDFLSISGTSAASVGDLISQAGAQQKTASNFVALTKSLKARGASKELLQQLSDAGPGSQLANILGQKSVTTQDIGKLNKLMSSGNKLATSFGKDMADLMYDSGKDAGKGFLAGLKGQEKALTKQMNKLAADLVKAIKKALKIKSPSGVFRDEIGRNVVLGMAHGIDMHGHLVGAATQRLADTATGVSLRRRYVPTAAPNRAGRDETWERLAAALEQQASQPQHLTGELVLDSGELLGVVRGTVKPMIRASEDRQAYRARVGRRSG